jgi:site-specific recombinase XerD
MRDATAPRPPSFASLVQQFFTEYLVTQRALSPRTIASYRDALMLFLDFAHQRLRMAPTVLRLADIEPDLILAFLDHLEQQRHNTVRSRNLRLTALRAFLKFAARRDVSSLHVIERALGVPMKRFERPMLGFLSRQEMLAVMGEPGSTWTSQRDHLLLAMLYNTGARVSEIIGVRVADVVLDVTPCVHLRGKGRKQRSVPLWKITVQEIRAWLRRNPTLGGGAALLPNRDGRPMTRANVNQRLDIAVARASNGHSSLAERSISPHTIRHTTAMHLLQSGVAFSVIALWLGHESTTTTHRYVEADLAMKDKALARLQQPDTKMRRYRPRDALMQFLQAL